MFNEWDVKNIGSIRRRLGLTQKELARLSGVSQSLIAKVESGQIDPAYSKVISIFEALENEINKKEEVKTAKEFMNKKIYSISSSEKLDKVIHLMRSKGISQLPVFKGANSVGSISETMFMDWIQKYGDAIGKVKVEEVMNDSFPTVPEGARVELIAKLLSTYNAVLVKNRSTIIGIITKADLINAIK